MLVAEVRWGWSTERASTVPVPAGDVAVIEVAELTVKPVAAAPTEGDRGGAGEVGAGDGDRGAAGGGPAGGLTEVTVGRPT